MAITDTKQAKDFTAGAPNITLKGDLTPTKMAMSDDANERALERIYEDLLEEGMSPEEAAKKARELFEQRSLADGGRVQYGLGSLVKSVKKAVKGVVKGVKDNPLLAAAALNFAPALIPGGKAMFFGGKSSLFGNPLSLLNLSGAKTGKGAALDALKISGVGAAITGLLAAKEQQPGESDMDFAKRRAQVNDQLNVQFKRLYPKGESESDQDYEVRIDAMVEAADDSTVPVGEMAEGGRVQYGDGSVLTLMDGTKVQIPEGAYKDGKFKDIIYSSSKGDLLREEIVRGLSFAVGGRVGRAFGSDKLVEQASGIEGLPINVNSKGVKELDLRETGGFIPPVGVKEKADDIPAMLSNNEFVFTADAVRAAGGGSVNKGAQRMYDLMKNLESKVV